MRIASGKTDQHIYFVAKDSSGNRLTGLSSFTVYRSRNGAAAVAMDTPTLVEVDDTNTPGKYALLVDEDTTIGSTTDAEEMALTISHAGMVTLTRTIELFRPVPLALAAILATTTIKVTSNIAWDSTLWLISGDGYHPGETRRIVVTAPAGFPDLTTAEASSLKLRLRDKDDTTADPLFEVTGTATSATQAEFEISASNMDGAELGPDQYGWSAKGTFSSDPATFGKGPAVIEDGF